MLSVGDGIAVGGFIIVVAQFVLAKKNKNSEVAATEIAHTHGDASCAFQFNELDRKVVVFENELKHANITLHRIEKNVENEIAERKATEKQLFIRMSEILQKVEAIRKNP